MIYPQGSASSKNALPHLFPLQTPLCKKEVVLHEDPGNVSVERQAKNHNTRIPTDSGLARRVCVLIACFLIWMCELTQIP